MAPPTNPFVVSGPEALSEFRQGLTGDHVFTLLGQSAGRLLISLAVGVGKTDLLVKTVVHAKVVDRRHDLVVVLVPRWDILGEILHKLPPDLDRVVLKPRPRVRCGDLDAIWSEYESSGCGLLARKEVCGICPRRRGCPWPDQYSKSRLAGAGLILATQQHLAIDPWFIDRLRDLAGADNVLTLVDESDLLIKGFRRTIDHQELQLFNRAQRALRSRTKSPSLPQREWVDLAELVSVAPTFDLQEGQWPFPRVERGWAVGLQRVGRELDAGAFRFLAHGLRHFARSDPASRERDDAGNLQFTCQPYLGDEFVIFSGSMSKGLARYRLDPDHRRPGLVSPYENVRFEHPETKWFNIGSIAGAAKYFPGNAPAVLDFFAEKIARNIRDGKRTLLVAKKKFRLLCAAYLTQRLKTMRVGGVKIITGDWDAADLEDPRTLPLINYGLTGVNRFEGFDSAFCLTGFYVNEATVAAVVHDIDVTTDRFPVRIETRGSPPRRAARVDLPDGRETILPILAGRALEQKEGDVVVQAVGRIRPYTKPREVITFHAGTLPGVRFTREFLSISQARAYFDVPLRRRSEAESRAEGARRLKIMGLSKRRIAEEMGVSLSSIKRYLR